MIPDEEACKSLGRLVSLVESGYGVKAGGDEAGFERSKEESREKVRTGSFETVSEY